MVNFKFYVINYNFNSQKVEMWNIFNNFMVREEVEKIIKKYLRNPKKYTCSSYMFENKNKITGFKALCEDIRRTIMWQEWSRCEYEILVGGLFESNIDKMKKIDCYDQALPNIEIIARECLYQYKCYLKEKSNAKKSNGEV